MKKFLINVSGARFATPFRPSNMAPAPTPESVISSPVQQIDTRSILSNKIEQK
jgi:hypothetical protein